MSKKTNADSDKSWTVSIDDINTDTWDLSVKNPTIGRRHRHP